MPIGEWLQEECPQYNSSDTTAADAPPAKRPLECMQRGGDILFVPQWHAHGTYIVQESVGVAVEIGPSIGTCSSASTRTTNLTPRGCEVLNSAAGNAKGNAVIDRQCRSPTPGSWG
jgi:hypothetical protein